MDKIVFLEDGRVEAVGTHDALYHSCPEEYRRMVDLQRLEDETADSSDAVGTSDIADSVDAPRACVGVCRKVRRKVPAMIGSKSVAGPARSSVRSRPSDRRLCAGKDKKSQMGFERTI